MGAYINPENESKEMFLIRVGERLDSPPTWEEIPDGFLPVVLVDNGFFTAAGIIFSRDELSAFTLPDDFRPKKFYLVKKTELYEVSDLNNYLPRSENPSIGE